MKENLQLKNKLIIQKPYKTVATDVGEITKFELISDGKPRTYFSFSRTEAGLQSAIQVIEKAESIKKNPFCITIITEGVNPEEYIDNRAIALIEALRTKRISKYQADDLFPIIRQRAMELLFKESEHINDRFLFFSYGRHHAKKSPSLPA